MPHTLLSDIMEQFLHLLTSAFISWSLLVLFVVFYLVVAACFLWNEYQKEKMT